MGEWSFCGCLSGGSGRPGFAEPWASAGATRPVWCGVVTCVVWWRVWCGGVCGVVVCVVW